MITRIMEVPDNMVAFKATGTVTKADFEAIVLPACSKLAESTGKLNYLMQIDTGLKDFTAGAWFQDLLLGLKQFTNWHRSAIVSDSAAINKFTDLFSFVAPGEFKGFTPEELDAAIAWTSSSA